MPNKIVFTGDATSVRPPIVTALQELRGLSGPDTCILHLRSGRVLLIGDEGINEFECEAAMHEGEPCGGMMFQQFKTEPPQP